VVLVLTGVKTGLGSGERMGTYHVPLESGAAGGSQHEAVRGEEKCSSIFLVLVGGSQILQVSVPLRAGLAFSCWLTESGGIIARFEQDRLEST